MKAKKIVSIHQPAYMPWLGWIHKLMVADTFVLLDTVQFEKNSFTNRNRIVQPDGTEVWLTVPILSKGKSDQLIMEVEINWLVPWIKKHMKAIYLSYHNCPYYADHIMKLFQYLENTKPTDFSSICNLFLYFLLPRIKKSEGRTTIKLASEYYPPLMLSKSDLVLEICLREKADIYFSGVFGKGYLNERKFMDADIEIVYQDYQHPSYEQHQLKNKERFYPRLAVLDLLFNYGPESLDVLMEGNVTKNDIRKEVADKSRTKRIEVGIRRTIEFVEGLNG